jgi:hypothetical protein
MYIYIVIISISGICKKCRYLIKAMNDKDSSKSPFKPIDEQMEELTMVVQYISSIGTGGSRPLHPAESGPK